MAVLAPVLALVMFAGGVFVERTANGGGTAVLPAPTATAGPSAGPVTPDQELALVEQAWHDIQDNYVDAKNLDNQKLAYAAIRGLTDAVGDSGHTSFMTAEEAKAADQSLSGTFVGIGVQVADKDGAVVINSVIPNTPAQAAGLKRNDRIVAVDGVPTKGMTVDAVVSRVRGPEGENVTLTLGRDGTADFDVTITRRSFDLPQISWAMVPGRHVAMIRLDQFSTGATKALQDAIKSARDAGATAIIFDLRDNPGGYVSEAVGVASQFVGDG
ncbi:MAG: PDZ domain-containing protein, partial [Chloroflexota bacterium]